MTDDHTDWPVIQLCGAEFPAQARIPEAGPNDKIVCWAESGHEGECGPFKLVRGSANETADPPENENPR